DGRPDIFVTNIFSGTGSADMSKDTGQAFENRGEGHHGGRAKGNNLLINKPGAEFVDRAAEYGVRRTANLWGWAAVMTDLDNDGDPDLVHANNEKNSITTGGGTSLVAKPTPPAAWEFVNGTFVSLDPLKLGFKKQDGRGMAQLDFDRDGDIDIAVANNEGAYRLYENQRREPRGGITLFADDDRNNALQVLVRGKETYLGHGARVRITVGDRTEHKFVTSKTDYLSQDSRVLHVGLGDHATADRVVITWDDGSTLTLSDVAANQRLVVYPNGTVERIPLTVGSD
ncbi:MAG: CRTAC1 family protein, partial [Haloarculaceae archaeon]